ncbi:MAG: DUF885 family protein [Desulfosarcina sp.]|nr:DUF885 family protein [Desulfosarcina sp.]MBC2744526.1 DUF885 family protein [Desulfosarcina sp.]MBC2767436.1 DUF885 domain-containing protein [Desulfosarcina sp.]
MPDQDFGNNVDRNLPLLADDIFESLATQFPVCMASDEFHFFPQAKARAFDWSRWDDFSPESLANAIGKLTQWERQLRQHASSPLLSAQAIDAAMLRRVVQTLRDQLTLARVVETQPTFYLTIVGIGLAEAFEAESQALKARLRHLPTFLDQARQNLNNVPRLFRDLGIEMLVKQQKWLDSLSLPEPYRIPIDEAFNRLGTHLRQARVREDFLPLVELYERMAFHHMGCLLKPDDIARELETEIAETQSILIQSAESIAPGCRWQAVVDGLIRPPMPPGGAREIYQNTISELARHCSSQGLFTTDLVRKCPVTVQPIPDYMRPVRSNAAFSMPPHHPPQGGTFFIIETGKGAQIPADYRLLAAHETFPGHHLLDTSRWRHERSIRRHIEFPIFYEGWASFSEELMFETGFFSGPIDRMLMAKRRFWRAMRGKVDFDIHMRRRTLDESAAFLASQGMDLPRAKAMVRRYSLKPGYQLSYTIGRCRFRRLYDNFCIEETNPIAFARCVLAQGEIGFNHLEQVLQQGG